MTLQQWHTPGFTRHHLRYLHPPLQLQLLQGFSRLEETVLCRLRLGVTFARSYPLNLKMAKSTECSDCAVEETIEHLLCHCPTCGNERMPLRARLRKITRNISTVEMILCPWHRASQLRQATKALLHFLNAIGLINHL